jgi:hypothetical protein
MLRAEDRLSKHIQLILYIGVLLNSSDVSIVLIKVLFFGLPMKLMRYQRSRAVMSRLELETKVVFEQ